MGKPPVVTILTFQEFKEKLIDPCCFHATRYMEEAKTYLGPGKPAELAAGHAIALIALCEMFNADPADFLKPLLQFRRRELP